MTPEQALAKILNRLQALIPQNQIGEDIVAAVNVEREIIMDALDTCKAEQHDKEQELVYNTTQPEPVP